MKVKECGTVVAKTSSGPLARSGHCTICLWRILPKTCISQPLAPEAFQTFSAFLAFTHHINSILNTHKHRAGKTHIFFLNFSIYFPIFSSFSCKIVPKSPWWLLVLCPHFSFPSQSVLSVFPSSPLHRHCSY